MNIGEGAGLAGASGVRPFLPALLAGALARGNHGIDFDHTSYSFLENEWFLVGVFVLAVLAYAVDRRSREGAAGAPGSSGAQGAGGRGQDLVSLVLGLFGLALGALLFAGSLADGTFTSWPGLIGGILCAVLGYFAVARLFGRARRRLRGSSGALALLGLYADGIALVLAGLSIAVPPIAYAALAAFLLLIARARGEGAQKFEGLRILR